MYQIRECVKYEGKILPPGSTSDLKNLDKAAIDKLIAGGWIAAPVAQKSELETLRAEAADLGIDGAEKMNTATLIKKIEEIKAGGE